MSYSLYLIYKPIHNKFIMRKFILILPLCGIVQCCGTKDYIKSPFDVNDLKNGLIDISYIDIERCESDIINCVVNSPQFNSKYLREELVIDISNKVLTESHHIKKKNSKVQYTIMPIGIYVCVGYLWTDYKSSASVQIVILDTKIKGFLRHINFTLIRENKKWSVEHCCGFDENGEDIFETYCK